MLKLFEPWTRRQDLTHDQAVRHWIDIHVPLVREALGDVTLRYVANVGLPVSRGEGVPAQAPPYDGIAEHWLDVESADEVIELWRRNAPTLAPDSRLFIGTGLPMMMKQIVQVDRGRAHRGVKTMFLLTRRPEMTREESNGYWVEQHATLVRETFGDALVRYVTNIPVPGGFGGWADESPLYDGIAELWFDGTQEETFALVQQFLPIFVPDERRFLGTYSVFVSDERLQKGDPEAPLPA